ncbi:MAG: hypothetical protein OEY86_00960 [Nitrospira sp.]|nr:hypothetical protein [Nitrospira sp.]
MGSLRGIWQVVFAFMGLLMKKKAVPAKAKPHKIKITQFSRSVPVATKAAPKRPVKAVQAPTQTAPKKRKPVTRIVTKAKAVEFEVEIPPVRKERVEVAKTEPRYGGVRPAPPTD